MKKIKNYKYIIFALCVLLLAAVVILAVVAERKAARETVENAGAAEHADLPAAALMYGDDSRALREHIDTLLLLGTDSESEIEAYDKDDIIPYYNYEQVDFLVLLVFDNDEKTCMPIQINRDTMVDDPWLSVTGEVGGTVFEQIALSHTTGSGLEDSSVNTRNAVSSLLFDAPIENYLKIPMTAVPILNDLVGGVTVTITDNMTPVDADFIMGETITLRGEQSLRFVRARSAVGDGTNISRMRRQKDYLEGFMKSARAAFDSDSELAAKAIEALNSYMLTDLTADALSAYAEKLDTYTIYSIQQPAGENILGEEYYEFYVDYADLWEIICEAMCADQ